MTVNSPKKHIKPIAVATGALIIFATILGVLVAGDRDPGWDVSFARWIQRWRGDVADGLYTIGDMLGTTAWAAIAVGAMFIVAVIRKHVQLSLFLLLVLVFRLAGTLLKPIFDSPRPSADRLLVIDSFDGSGYPSGHSMTSAMLATIAIVLAWNYLRDPRWRISITIISIGAMVLVGWSRIWAGAHWPTDVLGGWSYGIALVLLAWIVSVRMSDRIRPDTAERTATH